MGILRIARLDKDNKKTNYHLEVNLEGEFLSEADYGIITRAMTRIKEVFKKVTKK